MLRLGLKSLLAHKIRFALTAITIVIGVAFITAAFVTADSLRAGFNQLAEDINTGTDFTVQSELPFGDIATTPRAAVEERLVAEINALEGVSLAAGGLFVDGVIPVDGSGEAITTFGPPIAGANWLEDETLSQLFLIEGAWPQGITEFAIDIDTYENYNFEIGNSYQITAATGPRDFTLTGVGQFGFPENAGLGAIISIFDTATAQEVLDLQGKFSQIGVRAAADADLDEVQRRIEAVLPIGVEVVTAEQSTQEFSDATETFIGPFQTILLVFAFIVLFVSLFIISNTFNIVLGQRVRELSLMRAIGATPQQVRRSVLTESAVIGVFASAAGLGLGMAGALGLRGLLNAFGASLPGGSLPLTPRTIIWAVIVGVGFTVLASLVPAIKASRISPIAGLSEHTGGEESASLGLRRLASGGLLLVIGLVLTAVGLFADSGNTTAQLTLLGVGAAITFVAVAVLSPLVARWAVYVLARPLSWFMPISGRMARKNAARNPRRTSATAIALTIGLALVTMVSVVGQSLKVSFTNRLASEVTADWYLTPTTFAGLPKTLSADVAAAGLGTAVGFDADNAQIVISDPPESEDPVLLESEYSAVRVSDITQVMNFEITAGDLAGFDPRTQVLVDDGVADEWGLVPGDTVAFMFANNEAFNLSVAATYPDGALWEGWIIDTELHNSVATTAFDEFVLVSTVPALADVEVARARLGEVLEGYPQAELQTGEEFRESVESDLNTVLTLVNVFLGFALLIALVGIVNTLTLSVFERIREIGLLRAVGMSRRQMRRMIRWEAAVVALYGAVVGVILGGAFGIATSQAIPSDIIDTVDIPYGQVVLFLLISVLFGLIAALFPAFRASRMNVLDAIADE